MTQQIKQLVYPILITKANEMHRFSHYFDKLLYMFRARGGAVG